MTKKRKTELQSQEAISCVRESTSGVVRLRDLQVASADEKLLALAHVTRAVQERAEGTTRALLLAAEVLPNLTSSLKQAQENLKKLQGAQGRAAFKFADSPMRLHLDDAIKEVDDLLSAVERVRVFVGENAPDIVSAVGSVAT